MSTNGHDRSGFLMPEQIRRYLKAPSTDSYVEFKKELSYGEQRRMSAQSLTTITPGQTPQEAKIGIDFVRLTGARMRAYLVNWGGPRFLQDGRSVPVSEEAIDALDVETANEIDALLDEHLAAFGG
jgi:hypothetical protein